MRRTLLVLTFGSMLTASADAQTKWVGSIQGGYSVSTSTAENFPAGGSFGTSAFIGRQVKPLLAVGFEAGFFDVENTTTVSRGDCFFTGVPLGCNVTSVVEVNWIQFGGTARIGESSGHWRPYGALGLAVYFGTRDADVTYEDIETGQGPYGDGTVRTTRTAVGGSIGGGLDWAPNESPWSLGLSARLHYLIGGDENGEFAGDTFVTLLAGVGYRW